MRNYLFYLLFIFSFFGCKDDKSKPDLNNNNKVVSNTGLLKGWKTYSNDSIKVNIPLDWKPQSIDDALLYIPVNKKKDLYYVVLNYNSSKVDSKTYIKEIFNQVSKKNTKFKYLLNKISLKNTHYFYTIEFYINDNKVNYKVYSLIYDTGSQIYDFSYKTLDNKKDKTKNYQTFYSVLFSFEHKYDNVIDADKFMVKNEKILRYEDL